MPQSILHLDELIHRQLHSVARAESDLPVAFLLIATTPSQDRTINLEVESA